MFKFAKINRRKNIQIYGTTRMLLCVLTSSLSAWGAIIDTLILMRLSRRNPGMKDWMKNMTEKASSHSVEVDRRKTGRNLSWKAINQVIYVCHHCMLADVCHHCMLADLCHFFFNILFNLCKKNPLKP